MRFIELTVLNRHVTADDLASPCLDFLGAHSFLDLALAFMKWRQFVVCSTENSLKHQKTLVVQNDTRRIAASTIAHN
ncbi:hypothetical protein [Roseibium sp. SCP14]|uniref:hypothetical protein n=1 Tax=Roseibium sp. SCP14 TaxID=3141375 RepID=UPI00333AA6DA